MTLNLVNYDFYSDIDSQYYGIMWFSYLALVYTICSAIIILRSNLFLGPTSTEQNEDRVSSLRRYGILTAFNLTCNRQFNPRYIMSNVPCCFLFGFSMHTIIYVYDLSPLQQNSLLLWDSSVGESFIYKLLASTTSRDPWLNTYLLYTGNKALSAHGEYITWTVCMPYICACAWGQDW